MRSLFALSLLIAVFSFAGETTFADSPPRVWEGTAAAGTTVKVVTQSKGVNVTVNRDQDRVPTSVGITFFNASGKATTLELKGVDLRLDPAASRGMYSGSLPPSARSFVGFELQIPFGARTRIRSQDLKSSE